MRRFNDGFARRATTGVGFGFCKSREYLGLVSTVSDDSGTIESVLKSPRGHCDARLEELSIVLIYPTRVSPTLSLSRYCIVGGQASAASRSTSRSAAATRTPARETLISTTTSKARYCFRIRGNEPQVMRYRRFLDQGALSGRYIPPVCRSVVAPPLPLIASLSLSRRCTSSSRCRRRRTTT